MWYLCLLLVSNYIMMHDAALTTEGCSCIKVLYMEGDMALCMVSPPSEVDSIHTIANAILGSIIILLHTYHLDYIYLAMEP